MAEFQSVLGIVLVVTAVVIIALAIYNLVVINKATIDTEDIKAKITDGEKKGALAVNVILALIGCVLGVYGIVLLLPERKVAQGVQSMRGSRSLTGAVLTPTGAYM